MRCGVETRALLAWVAAIGAVVAGCATPRAAESGSETASFATTTASTSVRSEPESSGGQDLAGVLYKLASRLEADGAILGVYVADAATSEPLFDHRKHTRLVPASTMKLITTSYALATLGPGYRFRTRILREGPVEDGVLSGDLRIESSGDPSFGSWRWNETAHAATCERVASALAKAGVKKWRGKLKLSSFYDGRAPLGPGWAWDDTANVYSAPPTRFTFRENVVAARLVGDPASCERAPKVFLDPPIRSMKAVVLGPARSPGPEVVCRRDHGSHRALCFWRRPAANCPREAYTDLSIDDPLGSFSACVDDALSRAKIAHSGRAKGKSAPESLLVEFQSPPLSELVRVTNKESLNLYAERLALALTHRAKGVENYDDLRLALAEEGRHLGLPSDGIVQVDGSGLSRYNLATPFALASVVRTGIGLPSFEESLPISGVDGTLAKRVLSAEVSGKIRAKTGTLSGHRNLVGVADRPSDPVHPRIVFALMAGNLAEPSAPAAESLDRAIEALVLAPIH